nr:non-ribosomal peptide synthetase [Gordonia soli]
MRLPAGEQLVAHVVGPDVDQDTVHAAARSLPAYMRPSAWVFLDEMPLTTSGKIDRRALPAPVREADEHQVPTTPAEQMIAEVFADVLGVGVAEVSATDDFFDIGGNSLAATRVTARVAERLAVEVGIRDVFEAPTVRGLATLLATRPGVAPRHTADPMPRPPILPTSSAQRRMWFLNQYDPTVASYVIPFAFRLGGAVDLDVVEAALVDVVDRHEILRTRYPAGPEGLPIQEILPSGGAVDWSFVDTDADALDLVERPYDLVRDLPVRARVSRRDDTGHALLVITVHHIAADGESGPVLARDLMSAYLARTSGTEPRWPALRKQYADHVLDLTRVDTDAEQRLRDRVDHLTGAPSLLDLPTHHPRPHRLSGAGATVRFTVPGRTADRVRVVARRRGLTEFMVLHAALAATVSRLSGTSDVVIGTATAGRGAPAVDDLIGMFVNTVALRTTVRHGDRFDELLDHVGAVDLEAFAHADIPFDDVVDALGVPRSDAFAPLVQVLLTTSDAADGANAIPAAADLGVEPVVVQDASAKVDLTIGVQTGRTPGAPWQGTITYATDLHTDSSARRLGSRFVEILSSAVADDSRLVGDLALRLADDPSAIIHSTDPEPSPILLPDMLTRAAAARPHHPAVVAAEGTWSYADLDAASTRLARRLIAKGIGPDDVVVSLLPRSATTQLALWAIAKAGAVYCPVDPRYPADRIRRVLSASGARLGITDASIVDAHAVGAHSDGAGWGGVEWLVLDPEQIENVRHAPELAPVPPTDADRTRALRHDDGAYLIFTSGSTGEPKGVLVTHTGLAGVAHVLSDRHGSGADARWLGISSPAFDAAILEILGTYGSAATLVVTPPDVIGGRELAEYMIAGGVTHAFLVTSVAASLPDPAILPLTHLLLGGEAVPDAEKNKWAVHLEVHNGYGPTETTVISVTSPPISTREPVHLGRPVPGVIAEVLDDRLHPVPPGVVGELYLRGPALARGYHRRASATAERFVAAPTGSPGAVMYRTGDLVRRTVDGRLVYVGRTDHQVKLRGQRLELGEIERTLTDHPAVRAAAVVSVGDPITALAGYLEPADELEIDVEDVRAFLAARVPGYMVPATMTALDALPRNPIGKIDRAALPTVAPVPVEAYTPPVGRTEQILATIVGDVLGDDSIGVTVDFFAAGGNSLSATRVSARASDELGVRVGVRDIFEAPTVRRLARRLDAAPGTDAALRPLRSGDRPSRIPLSYAQQRIWFLNRFDPGTSAYTIPLVLRLRGGVDLSALRTAVDDLLDRHEVLRTVFPADAGVPYQQILSARDARDRLVWEVLDAPTSVAGTGSAADGDTSASPDAAEILGTTGFDVTQDLPIRVRVLVAGPREYIVALVLHHIAADGQSMRPLTVDLAAAYRARSEGRVPDFAELPVQFADHAVWQRDTFGDVDDPESVLGRQAEYWVDRLTGLPDLLPLPTDRPRPVVASQRGAQIRTAIPADLATRIVECARRHGLTEFMVLHAATAILLARLTAGRDVVISTPVAGRGHADLDDLVGMFVNTIVLRTHVDPDQSIGDLMSQIRSDDLDALSRVDVPFEYLVDRLSPHRSEAFAPLAQVMLSVLPAVSGGPALVEPGADPGELEITPVSTGVATTPLDLTIAVGLAPDGDDWEVEIVYAADLFDSGSIATVGDRLVRVLEAITDEQAPFADDGRRAGRPVDDTGIDDTAVGDIEIDDDAERSRIAAVVSGRHVPQRWQTIPEAIAERAAQIPDAVAIDAGERSLTYREFVLRVSDLAAHLTDRGVGPDVSVGVCIPRSIELVIAIHAIGWAGGAYVTIDPAAPAARAAAMVDSADVRLVVVADDLPAPVAGVAIETVTVDATTPVDVIADLPVPASGIRSDNALYTMFTSGSTGTPKGVTQTHRAVLNRLAWMQRRAPLGIDDAVLLKTPATFDVSVPELYAPLLFGARMVISADGAHVDPTRLVDVIRRHRVTSVHFVPSMMAAFAEAVASDPGRVASLSGLRRIQASGEVLTGAVARTMAAMVPNAVIDNTYGPTETAVEVTGHVVRADEDHLPIGGPADNSTTWVLDDRLRPTPVGVTGELYVGGAQLARGYAARPDLTAERFVADPTGTTGERLYRTGDLVRWSADGELEYLGRADLQVKLRGQRIELGEIEAVLQQIEGVGQAAVAVHHGHGGDALVGYVVGTAPVDVLRDEVGGRLPEYMRPTRWVVLDDLPTTPTGKLDRRRLPAPEVATPELVEPADAVERAVADVIADVLGLEEVSVTVPFFDLGGNSLAAMRVVGRLSEAFGVDLDVRSIFSSPTVRGLARTLARRRAAATPLVRGDRPASIPLSHAQQRIWFINQFDVASPVYNMPFALQVRGHLDIDALRQAMLDVIGRHEPLRTVYPMGADGTPRQQILDLDVAASMLRRVSGSTVDETMALMSEGFDVTSDLPIRMGIARETDGPSGAGTPDPDGSPTHRVVVVIHHIAGDAASLQIFARELLGGYERRVDARGEPLVAPTVGYADHTLWQRTTLGEIDEPTSIMAAQYAFWERTLDAVPEMIEVPTNRPRPEVMDATGGRVRIELGARRAASIADVARTTGTTSFMVCHAAFAETIARIADVDDVLIGAALSGRTHPATVDLIGMFVNTVVLRTIHTDHQTGRDLLLRVRDTDLAAFAHADIPFESLVERLAPARSTAHAPLVQVMINYLSDLTGRPPADPPIDSRRIADLEISALDPGAPPAKVDLTLGLAEHVGSAGELLIDGEIDYATALFDVEMIEVIREVFLRMVDAIVGDPDTVLATVDTIGTPVVIAAPDEVPWSDPMSDGTGVADRAVVVLDRLHRPVPRGVPGEVYLRAVDLDSVGGDLDPVGGELDVPTGHVGRWTTGGDGTPRLEHLGRSDRHVRIRGRRVDLDHVESTLSTVDGIADASVHAEDAVDGTRLRAAVVRRDSAVAPGADLLRRRLAEHLPAHEVPPAVVIVSEIPRAADGTIDGARLHELMPEVDVPAADGRPIGRWERMVADAMADVTGTSVDRAGQSFFDLGGSSLSAIHLVSRLRRESGVPVEVAWVFSGPTPRDLGSRIAAATHETPTVGIAPTGSVSDVEVVAIAPEVADAATDVVEFTDQSGKPTPDVVVPLRAEGSRPPLFCIHPADGLSWLFGGLAPHLDDRPVYGLQDPYVVADGRPDASIHDLARRYVDEIRRVAPNGPYHLLGWSIGGVIAHDMAVELRSRGHEVGLLALVDSFPAGQAPTLSVEPGGSVPTTIRVTEPTVIQPPVVDPALTDPDAARELAPVSAGAETDAVNGQVLEIDARRAVLEGLLGGWREVIDVDELDGVGDDPEAMAAALRARIVGLGLLSPRAFDRMLDRMIASDDLTGRHRPQILSGDAIVVVAAADKDDPDALVARWTPHITGGLRRMDVAVDHLAIIGGDALPTWMPIVEAAMLESDRR